MISKMSSYLRWLHMMDLVWLLKFNRSSRLNRVRNVFLLVSHLGNGVFWYTLILGILLTQQMEGISPAIHMLLAGFTGTLIYKGIKGRASRPRPFEVHQTVFLGTQPLDRFSFPSGHTLHAVIFTWVAMAYYPWLGWLLIPFTLLVAASRVVLGLHYPTDVLAGAILGGVIAWVSLQI